MVPLPQNRQEGIVENIISALEEYRKSQKARVVGEPTFLLPLRAVGMTMGEEQKIVLPLDKLIEALKAA